MGSFLSQIRLFTGLAIGLLSTSTLCSLPSARLSAEETNNAGYAIVATPNVLADASWSEVVEALKTKYENQYVVTVIKWDDDAFSRLREVFPKYVCFVVQPEEATTEALGTIWQKTRELDDDPYGDVIWSIITGYDSGDALRLAKVQDCQIERACGGTSIPLTYFRSGVVFDEGKRNHWRVKKEGEAEEDRNDAPDDTTRAIAEELNKAQLFVTSGHASERNWSIGYSYKNGFFAAKDGNLYGVPSNDKPFHIQAAGSKIHLASGNCLFGHIDKPDCMALAMIRDANVDMLMGYVVPTWFGYMGWGVMDYYVEQPGRFTVSEAVFANNQALLHLLEKDAQDIANGVSEDKRLSDTKRKGLLFDRDVVALYGDPAWQNGLVPQDSGWKQTLSSEPSDNGETKWTLTIEPLKGQASYKLVDGNGSERSGRPFVQLLPRRVSDVKILTGEEYNPVITDNFILIPATQSVCDGSTFSVTFSSK